MQIRQEYEDYHSFDEEAREVADHDNLAEQFVNDKDSLSQAEIMALIQNEKAGDISVPADGPITSKAAGVLLSDTTEPSTSKADLIKVTSKADFWDISSGKDDFEVRSVKTRRSTGKISAMEVVPVASKADFVDISLGKDDFEVTSSKTIRSTGWTGAMEVVPVATKADIVDISSGKDDLVVGASNTGLSIGSAEEVSRGKTDFMEVSTGKSSLKTPPKNKVERRVIDSPLTAKSDSDYDFDEVMPVEPDIIEKVITTKPVIKHNIEVVINKNEDYKPEDDIFADIFPVGEAPKEILPLTPEEIKILEKSVELTSEESKTQADKIAEETKKTPMKSGGLQERVETFVREKVEIEQRKSQRTPEKGVNLNGANERDVDDIQTEVENPKSERISKELQVPQMSSEELKSLEVS